MRHTTRSTIITSPWIPLVALLAALTSACAEDEVVTDNTQPTQTTQAALLEDVEQVFVGFQTTCARTTDGQTFCWGFDLKGQVGDGLPAQAQRLAVPITGFDGPVKRIDGSLDTMCGISEAGSVYCWGEDRDGSLGPGDPMVEYRDDANPFLGGSFAATPQLVFEGDHLDVDFAGNHGCAVSMSGTISCWGNYSLFAEAGETFDTDKVQDIPVEGWMPASIASTQANDCALDTEGKVHCWGTGETGALGTPFDADNPSFESCSPTFPEPKDYKYCAKTPVETAPLGGAVISLVSGGRGGFCALREDGVVLCWGDNAGERFAGKDAEPIATPVEIALPDKATQIALGEAHFCALLSDGRVFCSGRSDHGQTGSGAGSAGAVVEVALEQPATHISAGYHSTCAVLVDGHVACWGLNDASQLGVPRDPEVDENDSDVRAEPVLVQLAADEEEVAR